MQEMTPDEIRIFLSQGTRTAKLATVRADGRPHVTPVWFILDGEDLVFTTMHDTVKAHNLQREPRLMLSVDDQNFPYAFVGVEGVAQIEALPPEELRPWTTAIARRYVPAAEAEAFGRRNAVEGELLVRVKVTKIISRKEMAG